MSKISELQGVELPIYDWLEQMGWTKRSHEELKAYTRAYSNPIIENILVAKVAKINEISEGDAKRTIDILKVKLNNPSPITGNEEFLDQLLSGITLTIEGKDRTVRLIDFDNIWNNDLTVTRQYYVQGSEVVKPDIVLLVNGIPLVPIEAKQRAQKHSNWLDGVKDLSLYETKVPKMIVCNLFGVAANGRIAKFGIPGHSSSYFGEWRDLTVDDTAEGNPLLNEKQSLCELKADGDEKKCDIPDYEKMKQTIVGLLQPGRVLDILRNFIVFERTPDKGIVKKVSRYQQLRAANRIVSRVTETDLKQGVAWHTQGSGKSLTMLFTAYKLRTNPKLKDPTVYIVVDRKDLRQQIGDTFDECSFPNTVRPLSVGQLKEKIKNGPAEVIITTVHKFRDLGGLVDPRENVIVLIDEAHRTEYGEFQSELKASLPNARRFAFTGTPILRTYREFGAVKDGKVEPYIDRYSIEDAIIDGATVRVRYTMGPVELQLEREKLKQGYAEITVDLDDEEKALVERRVRPWKEFLKSPERMARLAKDIAEDFKSVVEPDGFKAQVVAVDKEACSLYHHELLKYFDPSEIAVVMSQTDKSAGEELYNKLKDFNLADGELKEVIKKFKRRITPAEQKAGNNLKILIVCNMLLTGFDAPIEQTMYLDSPLRDHNLLQAIARTNRPYDDPVSGVTKQFGRVVDYVGVFNNYAEALAYDPGDLPPFESVEELAEQFPGVLDRAMQPFADITLEDTYECSIQIVRVLQTTDQVEFEKNVREVIQNYEALSPHPLLADAKVKNRYEWVLTIYEIYLTEFRRKDFDAELYASKTRKLIRESVLLKSFRGHLPEITIDDKYLENLRNSKLSAADKAEKMIRDIETIIRMNEVESPIYQDFAERLQVLIDQKKKNADHIESLLKELEELFSEVDEVGTLPERMGFSDKGRFDLYTEIKHAAKSFDDAHAREFVDTLLAGLAPRLYAGWQESDLERKRIATEIKALADGNGFEVMGISDNDALIEALVNRLVQHYGNE
jgi:type I restriction enzyme R subunit